MPPSTSLPAANPGADLDLAAPTLRDDTWLRLVRGMGLGFTTGLAAVGIAQVLATGDQGLVTGLLGNLTAGAISKALDAWSAAGKRPDVAEVAALLAAHQDELATQRTALAGLAAQTGLLRQALEEIDARSLGDGLTPAELERQFTLFGSNLVIALVDQLRPLALQIDAGFVRLERLLTANPALGSSPQPLDQALAFFTALDRQLRAQLAAQVRPPGAAPEGRAIPDGTATPPDPALLAQAEQCAAYLATLRHAQQRGATAIPPAPDGLSVFTLLASLAPPAAPGAAGVAYDQRGQMVTNQFNLANQYIANQYDVAGNLYLSAPLPAPLLSASPAAPPLLPPPVLPPILAIGVEPPGPPKVFAGRHAELLELDRALDAVTPSASRPAPPGKLVLIYGDGGVGKRELLRRWLANQAERGQAGPGQAAQPPAPRIARITFTPAELDGLQQAAYYRTQPAWRIDWERYGQALAQRFPQAFSIGSHPWVALAAQIVAQSDAARRLLADPVATRGLEQDSATPPLAALTALLRAAVQDGRPLILALEQFHAAPDPWLTLVQAWEAEVRAAHLPVLLVLTYDYPQALDRPEVESPPADVLAWLRRIVNAPLRYGQGLFLTRLRPAEVEQLLAPDAADYALDLYALTEGVPHLIEELLAHWQTLGLAAPGPDGRWQVAAGLPYTTPGVLYDELVAAPLEAAAARGADFGLDAATLRRWLDHAAWEGPLFTAAALERIALAGPHAPADHDSFEDLLDDVLCDPADPDAGLVQFDGFVEVPVPGSDEAQPFSRYKFCPPLAAHILRQRQDLKQRREFAHAYAQALEATYALTYAAVLPQLIALYQAAGLPAQADAYRKRARIEQDLEGMEATLAVAKVMATEEVGQRRLVALIVEYVEAAQDRVPGERVIRWLMTGLDLAQLLSSKAREGQILYFLAWQHSRLGDQHRAIDFYGQAIRRLQECSEKAGEAAALGGLGGAYAELGDRKQALKLHSASLSLYRLIKNKEGEGTALHNIGLIYSELGNGKSALKFYEKALRLRHEAQNAKGEAATLNNVGSLYAIWGDWEKALTYYYSSVALSRQSADKYGEASTLHGIGGIYTDIGEWQLALNFYKQSLLLRCQLGDELGKAKVQNNTGYVYAYLGQFKMAMDWYNQALASFQHVDSMYGEAVVQKNIGRIHFVVGSFQQARDCFLVALPSFRKAGDRAGEAFTLASLALAEAGLGNPDAGLAHLDQALPLARATQSKSAEAAVLDAYGQVYTQLGRAGEAVAVLADALALYVAIGERFSEVDTRTHLADAALALGDPARATAELRQAAALAATLGHPGLASLRARCEQFTGPD